MDFHLTLYQAEGGRFSEPSRATSGTVFDQCGQATKGIRWMTWHTEAKKDGVASEMLRGTGKRVLIRRYLNAETHFTAVRMHKTVRANAGN